MKSLNVCGLAALGLCYVVFKRIARPLAADKPEATSNKLRIQSMTAQEAWANYMLCMERRRSEPQVCDKLKWALSARDSLDQYFFLVDTHPSVTEIA